MRWILPETQIPGEDLVEKLLALRGLSDPQTRAKFLLSDLKDLHDSKQLYNSTKAAEVILKAVKDGKKIFIHGDYDVDGVCATSIMWDFLYRGLKADVLPYIPNRFDEGYGLSTSSLDAIIAAGGQLVITVDCGIKDIEKVAEYTEKGLQFVITDHHTLPSKLDRNDKSKNYVSDDALAVVHPKYPRHEYPFSEICGAAVAWKVVQQIVEQAELDFDTFQYLDLVALATVCDVMPLIEENRIFVKHGLERLRNYPRVGLRALLLEAGVKAADLATYNLGFTIGPRLNASGRMESAMDALKLIVTQQPAQAQELAQKLQKLNSERQQITQDLLMQAEVVISNLPDDQKLFFVYGENWPEGIIGLVAGKLLEKYHRPVLVGSILADGTVKGSARSISSFHIADALKTQEHLLQRYGGHAQAAGFALAKDNLEALISEITSLANDLISLENLEKTLNVDIILEPADLTLENVVKLNALEPYGFGNTTPVFALMGFKVVGARRFGSNKQHTSFVLQKDGVSLEAIDFGADDKWSHVEIGSIIDVAGTLSINSWNGQQNVQMVIKDLVIANA